MATIKRITADEIKMTRRVERDFLKTFSISI